TGLDAVWATTRWVGWHLRAVVPQMLTQARSERQSKATFWSPYGLFGRGGGGPMTPGEEARADRSSRGTGVAGPTVARSVNSEAGPRRPRPVRTGSLG